MTKADIINEIAKKTGLDKTDVSTAIESFFKVMKNSMAEGENVYIRGFGSFVIKKRAKKVARIISQDKPIVIDEHFVPSFKPAKIFINRIKESSKVKEKYLSEMEKKEKKNKTQKKSLNE